MAALPSTIVKMTASPINSDLGSVGMVARFGGSTVVAPLPGAAAGMYAADGDTQPVGSEGTGVVAAAAPSGVVAAAAPSLAYSGYSVVRALNYEVFGEQNLFFHDSIANRCAYEKLLMRLARYSLVGRRSHSVAPKDHQQ